MHHDNKSEVFKIKKLSNIGIILAAGMGTRLHPETNTKPKSLVSVYDKPILWYQISGFNEARIDLLLIITGYKSEKIEDYVKNISSNVSFPIVIIKNNDYKRTNNMYSLWLGYEHLRQNKIDYDVLFVLNGDVFMEKSLLVKAVRKTTGSKIFVDRSQYNEESMKIEIDSVTNKIINISKDIGPDRAYGVSIDLYRFEKDNAEILYTVIKNDFINKNILNKWTEFAIQRGFLNNLLDMYPEEITGYTWWEIDNFQDLERAKWLQKFRNEFMAIFEKKRIFAFDIDGTVVTANQQIPYAKEFLELLHNQNKKNSLSNK